MTHKTTTLISACLLMIGMNAHADNIEIALIDNLDDPDRGYCFDIKGGNRNVDPNNGLQAHTCYSYQGSLGTDQIFDSALFVENTFFMPEYDVCIELSGLEAGATVGLAACSGSDVQKLTFSDDGKVSPTTAPELCLTAGIDTRTGRGGTPLHQMKALTLEACSEDNAASQLWYTRASQD